MTDLLFILTIVFVAYIVYTMVDEQKAMIKSTPLEPLPDVKPEPEIVVESAPSLAVKATFIDETPPPSVIKVTKTSKKISTTTPSTSSNHRVRNPKTGEITTTTGNYRFAKRWLKEALVAEQLLDKIYKSDELNAETEAKIKDALAALEILKKYQP